MTETKMMTEAQIRARIKLIDLAIERAEEQYAKQDANEVYQEFRKLNGIPDCHCMTQTLEVAKYNLLWVLGKSE